MARQPINSRLPYTGFTLGAGSLEERPKAAATIALCIAEWTEVELQTARLLAAMLNADSQPAIALYLSLANARAKREALDSIANMVFSGDYLLLYNAVIRAKVSIEKQRTDLAHGLFGIPSDDGDGVIWISTTDRIKNMLATDEANRLHFYGKVTNQQLLEEYMKIKQYVHHYTLSDLEDLLVKIREIHSIIIKFAGFAQCVINRNGPIAELYQRLSMMPLVREFLSPSSPHQKNDP